MVQNFCAKLYVSNGKPPVFKIITLNKGFFDKDAASITQSYDAVYLAEIQMLISQMYKSLYNKINTTQTCASVFTNTILTNGVAGCGKTHAQVHSYADNILCGFKPAIFSATKAAAFQALSRLNDMNVPASEDNVCTIDSFLMNKRKWDKFTHVYIDEALQLHCGKLYAVMEITNPTELVGYGDRKQITFINFTRFVEPSVDTNFPWQSERLVSLTRRLRKGKRITWLQNELLYGSDFDTAVQNKTDHIAIYARSAGLEKKISIEFLYKSMRISKSEPLLVLVYRADIARDLRMKLQVTRNIPESGNDHRLAVATIGESQGEDVPHSLLLRLSSKEETLYTKSDHTIVGLTRSSVSWGYISVPTEFPSLLEKVVASSSEPINMITIKD